MRNVPTKNEGTSSLDLNSGVIRGMVTATVRIPASVVIERHDQGEGDLMNRKRDISSAFSSAALFSTGKNIVRTLFHHQVKVLVP